MGSNALHLQCLAVTGDFQIFAWAVCLIAGRRFPSFAPLQSPMQLLNMEALTQSSLPSSGVIFSLSPQNTLLRTYIFKAILKTGKIRQAVCNHCCSVHTLLMLQHQGSECKVSPATWALGGETCPLASTLLRRHTTTMS